jgi:hypothetical protein
MPTEPVAQPSLNGPEGFQPITEDYTWDGDDHPDLTRVEHSQQKELEELLMGHKVDRVSDDHLLLDDGTVLRVIGNEGCGGCSSGWYELKTLNRVDNIITKVEFDYQPHEEYDDERDEGFYRIFVLAGDERINLLSVDGSDGNGYYGTGFDLIVRKADA